MTQNSAPAHSAPTHSAQAHSAKINSVKTLVLVGNVGSDFWQKVTKQNNHPLDNWTKKTLTALAKKWRAQVVFPFQGVPYYPFQQWALASGCFHQSPLGLTIHHQYGLWHAYRGAFLFDEALLLPRVKKTNNPCQTCAEKPCLSTCPVAAFDESTGYDVARCRQHLLKKTNQCLKGGCQARLACPVARKYRYQQDLTQHLMRAFVR